MKAGRRLVSRCILTFGLWAVVFVAGHNPLRAQEGGAQDARGSEQQSDNLGTWKLINTGLFALALGWFLVKYSPRFFNARSQDIQKAIKDATGLKIEADFRYSESDKRMAGLPGEVEKLRRQAEGERAQEHERIRRETQAEIERIEANSRTEIEALQKEGSNRVQLHTALLALGLAERRLRDQFQQSEPGNLMDDFIRLIEQGKN